MGDAKEGALPMHNVLTPGTIDTQTKRARKKLKVVRLMVANDAATPSEPAHLSSTKQQGHGAADGETSHCAQAKEACRHRPTMVNVEPEARQIDAWLLDCSTAFQNVNRRVQEKEDENSQSSGGSQDLGHTQKLERRITCLLVTLLRAEGPKPTALVARLLNEVPGDHARRSERLREHMRTILGSYECETSRAAKKESPSVKARDIDAFNLRFQNILYAPEVQTSLKWMQIPAPLASQPAVLAAIAETANEETLATDTVEALTAAAWLQLRAGTALDSWLCMVALACLCLVTWKGRYGSMDVRPALWTLSVIQGKETIEWLAQMGLFLWSRLCTRQHGRNHQTDQEGAYDIPGTEIHVQCDADAISHPAPSLETLADLIFLVAGYAAVFRQMDLCGTRELDQTFLPWFCAMYWLRLMYSLRGERWLGPYLLPILSAVRDTGAFFFVTSLCVAGATHAYVILNAREEDRFPIYSAFTHTVRLAIFGDFDVFEFHGQDTTYMEKNGTWEPDDPDPEERGLVMYMYLQLCFFCTGVGVAVLLMNLLIGILGQNYELHQDRAQVLFVQARARMLLEQQQRPWARLATALHRKVLGLGHGQSACCEDKGEPRQIGGCVDKVCRLAEMALIPLLPIMQPLHPRDTSYHQQRIFKRFVRRVLWRPMENNHCCALVIPAMSLLLLPGALVCLLSLMGFASSCVLVKIIGGQIKGLRYFINLSVFGLFGDHFADECQIFALVRKEPGMDDLRGMRTELKEKIQRLENELQEQRQEQKASLDAMGKKIDDLLNLARGETAETQHS